MFERKCYRRNDRTDRGIIPWFSWKGHFDMVFTSQIRVFHVRPAFSILCIIDVFLFVQHICIYVFCIYIYICMDFHMCKLDAVFLAAAGGFLRPKWRSWDSMTYNLYIFIVFTRISLIFIDFHRFSMISIDFYRFS